MKHVVTPLFISLMLSAGWAHAQTATGDVRESTDPSRAQEVEQKAQRLGDTVSPADQSSGASSGGSDSSTDAQKPYGSTPGAGDTSGAPAAAPGASGTSGCADTSPGAAGPTSGGGLKSGPEAGGMGGSQQPERRDQRFSDPYQPAR